MMSCIVAFDQWANPIQGLESYDGPEMNSRLLFTTMNSKARGADHSADRQSVSHRIIGPNYFTQSCWQTELSDSDQDNVKIVVRALVPENSCNSFIKRSNFAGQEAANGSAEQSQIFVAHGRKAVNGSANQNLPDSYLKSELTTGTECSHA